MNSRLSLCALLTGAAALAAPAQAQYFDDVYVSVSGGLVFPSDSDNDGEFTSDFLTGQGTAIDAGTPLPAGTAVEWTTEFDTGYVINGAVGARFQGFRGEVELSYESADVDTHEGVTVAGELAIDGEDAAILTGGVAPLGASVGAVVADGQGDISTLSVFANGYYDILLDGPLTPYVGAGLGWGRTKVDYSPSDVEIIDDKDSGFTWQVMGGASYAVNPTTDLFAGVRYRSSSDAEVDSTLIPATLDVENKRVLGEVGVRFGF